MNLKHLYLRNFRSFQSIDILFQPNITAFVGENNSGKSNAIDALRLITPPLNDRRELYCESTDIRFGSDTTEFEIEAHFTDLSPAQQGRLISASTDKTLETACFGLTYRQDRQSATTRPQVWAGHSRSTPEPGSHRMIRHVYLPPLRDAKRALSSGNPTRILALLNHFLGDGDPDALALALKRENDHVILRNVNDAVGAGLHALTSGVRHQAVSLGFSNNEKLIDIARDLRFKLSDHDIQPEDLRYSGHGYANLLYLSAIAVELEKVDNADLTLFLVEEPEAHLHPQFQASVLNFLEEQAAKANNAAKDKTGPAGEIQIVVATHSPNLTAWVSNKNIVYFRSAESEQPDRADEQPEPQPPQEEEELPETVRRVSRCIPLSELGLSDPERRKIDRYLDVTKSSLLFGGRVLLVEGIAEALLLPIIAKKFVLSGEDNKDAYRLFRSSVFLPIDGVDFEPYVKLLLTHYEGIRIADRVVVVTDGDKKAGIEGDDIPGAMRKVSLEAIAREQLAADNLYVSINTYSLESELYCAGNQELLKGVFDALHPRSEHKWEAAVAKTGDEFAKGFQGLFDNTSKGDFAHLVAEEINDGTTFTVPDYLRQAIKAIVA